MCKGLGFDITTAPQSLPWHFMSKASELWGLPNCTTGGNSSTMQSPALPIIGLS